MKQPSIEIPSCEDCEVKGEGVLCSLSKDTKSILSEGKGGNFYKKGQVIFYEGNHVIGLYCIFKGKVKLSKMGENGKEQIIRFAKTGDILGYRSLLSNESYQATATAMEDCWVCIISRDRFQETLISEPKLSVGILRLLSKDLKKAEQLLLNISQKTVRERLAEAITLLLQNFGYLPDDETLAVNLTRSELADIAGTTTETTIRTLAQLNEEGVVELSGKQIKILDERLLKQLAGS